MPDALVTEELIEYHRKVAAGGVGMNTVAYVAVSADGRTNAECLYMRDEAIPGLRKLTDAIHAEGAKASAQIGHNYLLSSFLAPGLNDRKDRWGGSLENRARLSRDVLRAIRQAVGGRVAILAKLNMVDGIPGGLQEEESLEVARMIESDGSLDALVLTGGSSYGNPMFLFKGDGPRKDFATTLPLFLRLGFKLVGRKFMPDTPFEEAYFEPLARRFKEALDLPVILLGGINKRETIERALEDGFAFVQMGRALLREPDLLRKMQDGRQSEGLCNHCNRCMPSIYSGTRRVLIDPEPIAGGPPVA